MLCVPLGILPSRTAALRQFRTPYFPDSIFIKELVSADSSPIADAASRLQGRQPVLSTNCVVEAEGDFRLIRHSRSQDRTRRPMATTAPTGWLTDIL